MSWRKNINTSKHTTDSRQAPAQQSGLDREHLHKHLATAMEQVGLWPAQLVSALGSGNMLSKGLLLCAVDVRGAQDGHVRLQVPIATEPVLAPVCKKLRGHPSVEQCAKLLRGSLPRKAALGFQFAPTDIWKGQLESIMVGFRVARQALKANNILVVLVWFITSSGRIVVLEIVFVRPGAVLPNKLASFVSDYDKERMFWTLGAKNFTTFENNTDMHLGTMGLDAKVLGEEPLFQAFRQDFKEHIEQWFGRQEHTKVRLMSAWCSYADAVGEEDEAFVDYVESFFFERQAAVQHLWGIMGVDRSRAVARSIQDCLDEEERHKGSYVAKFQCQYVQPCPACGKPLDSNSGYPCGCQRPILPAPNTDIHNPHHPPPAPATVVASSPPPITGTSYRRSKNIQTSFSFGQTNKEPTNTQETQAPTGAAIPASSSAAASGNLPTRKQNRKRAKELDPAMARLREEVRGRQPAEEEPSFPELGSTKGLSSRKSRRNAPQGDRKLAKMLAAGDVLVASAGRS